MRMSPEVSWEATMLCSPWLLLPSCTCRVSSRHVKQNDLVNLSLVCPSPDGHFWGCMCRLRLRHTPRHGTALILLYLPSRIRALIFIPALST